MGRGFYDDPGEALLGLTWKDIGNLNRSGYALVAFYWLASIFSPKPFLELAIKSTLSEASWEIWNQASDFIIGSFGKLGYYTQSVNSVSESYNAEEQSYWGLHHTTAVRDPRITLRALEEKPKIDTVYMSFPADGRVDTVILGLKEIDTVIANLDSVSMFFKLKDVYFLAQTKLSVNINGVNVGNLKYPENKGFNNRWCRIPSEYIRYLGAGLNELTITARNILGEQVSKTFKIWLVPAGWFVWNRFPEHREVFKPLNLNINTDSFSLYIIKEGLSPERLTIVWDSLFIIPVSLYQDTNNRWHFDTLEIKNYVNSDYYYHSPPGERYLIKPDGDTLPAYGKVFAVSFNDMRGYFDKDNDGRIDEGAYRFIYKINDSVKTITFLTGFYVDETPPVVELLEPEGVISGRKQKILFSFRAYDNLEQEIQTPDSMVFEIYRG